MRDVLDRFSRVAFAQTPTPLQRLPNLTRRLGVEIYVKRDDCTGLAMGGNKARKLEFLLGDAIDQGTDTIITAGAIQSNHARQTAAACAQVGLSCELILTDVDPIPGGAYSCNGNVLLDALFGASIWRGTADADSRIEMDRLAWRLRRQGKRPYVIPVGGSNLLGCLGYVSAAKELATQLEAVNCRNPAIVLATGSGGTQAGLIAGFEMVGRPLRVYGVSVGRSANAQKALVGDHLARLWQVIPPPKGLIEPILVSDNYIGCGYGQPTSEMLAACRRSHSGEDIMNQSFGDSLQLQVGPTLQFNKIGTINHIRLTVTDISKAERFYDP